MAKRLILALSAVVFVLIGIIVAMVTVKLSAIPDENNEKTGVGEEMHAQANYTTLLTKTHLRDT